MSPEDRAKLNEVYEWVQQRKQQQLSYPLDEGSRQTIIESGSSVADLGNGATALTEIYTDSNSDTHTGPKAYVDTRLIKIGAITIEVPYLSIS